VSGDLIEFENGGQKCIVIQTGHLLKTTRLSQKFALKFKNESEHNLKQRNLSFVTKKSNVLSLVSRKFKVVEA
jgi:hypothetical protein